MTPSWITTDSRRMLTIRDVAALLGISTRSVERIIVAKDIRATRIGASVRVSQGELNAYIAAHTTNLIGERRQAV